MESICSQFCHQELPEVQVQPCTEDRNYHQFLEVFFTMSLGFVSFEIAKTGVMFFKSLPSFSSLVYGKKEEVFDLDEIVEKMKETKPVPVLVPETDSSSDSDEDIN